MENRPDITPAEQFAAALDWWRDAGVDQDFMDEVQVMLAEEQESAPEPVAAQVAEKPAEPLPPRLSAGDLPDSIEAFHAWWTGEENPFAEDAQRAVGPRGGAGASVMVMVPMPEIDDAESLLSGRQGRLLGSILGAIGVDANSAYFASALPGHLPLPDWDRYASEGLGVALAHHVELVQPKRVILFGSKLPALFGHDPAGAPAASARFPHAATLATFAPDRLLDHARQRARFWKQLLDWTAP